MRGVLILGDQQVILSNFPDPTPGHGEVVVRVEAAGICGSDLHNWYWKTREDSARSGSDREIPGHEPVGVVEAVGEGVERVQPGQRVVVWAHCDGVCGRCTHCLSSEQWFCRNTGEAPRQRPGHGGYAEKMLAKDWQCMPLIDELSIVEGVMLACAGGTAYSVARRLDIANGQTVAIIGAGPTGIASAMVAQSLGARTIISDPSAERGALAREMGVDAVVEPDRERAEDVIRELTDGIGADVVIETSGSASGQREAVEAARPGGRVGFVGFGPAARRREGTINPTTVIWKQLTLAGVFVYPPSLFEEISRFYIERKIPIGSLVTHSFALSEASQAFTLFNTHSTGKVILKPGQPEGQSGYDITKDDNE